jgi:hypothetical protein
MLISTGAGGFIGGEFLRVGYGSYRIFVSNVVGSMPSNMQILCFEVHSIRHS